MHPPHILQTNAELFRERHSRSQQECSGRRTAAQWVVREMSEDFPLATVYPDVFTQTA